MTNLKYYLLTMTLISSLSVSVKAQNMKIPTPDSAGLHLFDLFQHRVDVEQSPLYSPYNERIEWASLLREADQLDLSGDNIAYNRTLFEHDVMYDVADDIGVVKIHVIFDVLDAEDADDTQYAFEATLVWISKWEIQSIAPKLYVCELATADWNPEFTPAIEDVEQTPTEYGYDTSYEVRNMDTLVFLPDVTTFNDDIFAALKNKSAFGTEDFFLTEDEFNEIMGELITDYKALVDADDTPYSEYAVPDIARKSLKGYQSQQVDNWSKCLAQLVDGSGESLDDYYIVTSRMIMTNHSPSKDNKIFVQGEITMTTSSAFELSFGYYAVYHKGLWRLLYVDDYIVTYTIAPPPFK